MKTTVAKAIIKYLEAEGIEQAFGISGSHFLAFYKALKESRIKYVSVKHEAAAGFMALNYTKVSQKPALIMGTAGAGAMNLLNGIAELYKGGLPALVITPLVASASFGKNGLQEDTGWGNTYSINAVMSHITRKSLLAHVPQVIPQLMAELLRFALVEHFGPVHLAVPSDYFEQEIEFEFFQPGQYRVTEYSALEPAKLDAVAEKMRTARLPVLLIGRRCLYPSAKAEIVALSHAFNVPVVATINAKGLFDEGERLFGGVVDSFGHRSADKLLKTADFIISCGVDFHEYTTSHYDPELLRQAFHVAVDADFREIGRNYRIDCAVSGSIKESLGYLARVLARGNYQSPVEPEFFSRQVTELNAFFYDQQKESKLPLKPQAAMYEISAQISQLVPEQGIVVSDIGTSCFWALRNFNVHKCDYFVSLAGASVGQGVAGCIGAKLAQPEKTVFCICGDGAFLMHGMELATAKQYNLGIIWIIFKDNKYNMVDFAQKILYGDIDYCTDIYVPDLARLAGAFEAGCYEVHTREDIKPALTRAVAASQNNISSLIIIHYDFQEPLPVKPHTVKMMEDLSDLNQFKPTRFFMMNLKNTLQEKV